MKQYSTSFFALVKEVKSRIEEINVHIVKKMINNKEDFKLLDVREESEWNNGHLPLAIHLGKGVIERDIEAVISNRNCKLVLYCGSGFRSALAARSIQKMGYENVLSMEGGFKAWCKEEFPIIVC